LSANPFFVASPAQTAPFDHIAETYDEVFTDSPIGRAQRAAVWRALDCRFRPGQHILELNCGTGLDAAHLVERGVKVLACDAAPRMIEVAKRRRNAMGPGTSADLRVLATERIAELEGEGLFDGAFSNFGGLNCVEDLGAVARNLGRLLRPGATALLCMMGRSAAWEIAWYLGQGKPRKALRRFQRGGAIGRLAEGVTVQVYYPSVRGMARIFAPDFKLVRLKGIGITVPPSYMSKLAQRFPRVLHALAQVDSRVSGLPVLRSLADHILLEFQRVTPQA
jgi:SAM-dependent methyltransferase